MKLTSFHVKDFRCVRDSDAILTDDITCLVGKNESGKTTLLQALYRLNPIVPEHGKFDVTLDYPRVDVEEYQQGIEAGTQQPVKIIEAVFTLEDAELAEIHGQFGKKVLPHPQVSLWRGYDSKSHFDLTVDEQTTVSHLVKTSGLSSDEQSALKAVATLKTLHVELKKLAELKEQAVTSARAAAEQVADASAKAQALDEAAKKQESAATKQIRASLEPLVQAGLSQYIYDNFIDKRIPKFLYFDEYYQMKGEVNLDQLKVRQSQKQLQDSDRPMLGLIDLARLNVDQMINSDRTEALISKLEGASNHLSKQVLKYWSQNQHIQLRFDVRPAKPNDPTGMTSGTNLWGRVYDSIHFVTTPMGSRSRGFLWFFSFLAWYSQQSKQHSSMILLLDEPGMSLHASAQADFLKFLEAELKPTHQVIYSTHSPFLVDPQKFERVRIVEDKSMDAKDQLPKDKAGTKVTQDVLKVSSGTLFPLQGALGYELAQALFLGPNTLLVEGPGDLVALQVISSLLSKIGRERLNPKWVITPVGGADKVPTFAALIGAQSGMNVATLIDFQKKDAQKIENLHKRDLLKKSHVLTFADFTGTPEADLEDMFDLDFYLLLLNSEFGTSLGGKVSKSDLPKTNQRLIVRINEVLKARSVDPDAFDHFRPIRYLAEHSDKMTQMDAASLDRFDQAFKAINALL